MEELYETKISDARWIAYDIPGNVGWIVYIVMMVLSFVKQPVFMEVPLVRLFSKYHLQVRRQEWDVSGNSNWVSVI